MSKKKKKKEPTIVVAWFCEDCDVTGIGEDATCWNCGNMAIMTAKPKPTEVPLADPVPTLPFPLSHHQRIIELMNEPIGVDVEDAYSEEEAETSHTD